MEQERKEEESRLAEARSGMKKYMSMGLMAFLVIAASILFFLFIYKIDKVISGIKMVLKILEPIVFGFLIAYIMYPMTKFFENALKNPLEKLVKNPEREAKLQKGLGIFLALVVWIAIVAVLMVMVIPELYTNIRNMVVTLPGEIQATASWLTTFLESKGIEADMVQNISEKALNAIQTWIQSGFLKDFNVLFGRLTNGIISFFSTTLNIVIGVVVAIYVLNGRKTFKRQSKQIIYAVFSRKHAVAVIDTLRDSNEIFGGFIAGKLVDSLIIGILCFLVLSILRMPYTVLVSVIVGVTNVSPFFGPYLGAIPSAILILLASPTKGLIFIVFIIILQQFDGNILGPKILGQSTGLTAFWVVFSILFFGGLFGIIGMLIGVPLFAVIYRIIGNIVKYRLNQKGLTEMAKEGNTEESAETDRKI